MNIPIVSELIKLADKTVGAVDNIVGGALKNKSIRDQNAHQSDMTKEQNRHETETNKDKLISQGVEYSQKNLEKSQSNEDASKQRESEATKSEMNAHKEAQQHTVSLLERKVADTEKHLNEIMELKERSLIEKQYLLNSIYNEKDRSFKKVLSVLDEIVSGGMDAFNNNLENRGIIKKLNKHKTDISTKNNVIRDELAVVRNDIFRLKDKLLKEEARYDQLIELRSSLSDNDYKAKFFKTLSSMLEIANKINTTEIELLRKENEKNNSDEKLEIIEDQLRSIEGKEFDALSSIKASFYAQKNIHNITYNKIGSNDSSIEVLGNAKIIYPNDTIRDSQLQNNNIKRLEN